MKQRNDFKLTQACRYLTQLATDNDQCVDILQQEGLDTVFRIMQDTAGDVAIQMSTCAAVVVICANPASKQYPAKVNGIYQISAGIQSNLNLQSGRFIGSYFGVLILSGTATIVNSFIQQSAKAIQLVGSDEFTMKYSEIKNNGQYYGPFISSTSDTTAGFQVYRSYNIALTNNTFSGGAASISGISSTITSICAFDLAFK